jgi:hypothetical protein
MTEKYYQDLDLPELPIQSLESISPVRWEDFGYFIETNPEKVLHQDLLDKFNTLGIVPGYLVIFTNTYAGNVDNRYLHKDRVTVEDPRTLSNLVGCSWRSVSFGINFEIYENDNVFYWHSENSLTAKSPALYTMNTPVLRAWLGGVHFENTDNIPAVCTKTVKQKPVLIRTDVPHRTTFEIHPNAPRRIGVSIRFYEPWTWEQALDIFQPIFSQ